MAEERDRPDLDRVRETMRERDEDIEERPEASDDLDEEPDHDPDDPERKRG